MALRYLGGKLRRVPAGAALRRVEGSRGVAHGRSQVQCAKEGSVALMEGKVPSATQEACSLEELKRLEARNAALIRQIREASSYRHSSGIKLAMYFSGGTVLGLYIVSLMLRYENRSGGKIGKMMCGIPTK